MELTSKVFCFVKEDNITIVLVIIPVFDTTKLGFRNGQTSFFLHFTNNGIDKGFTTLNMTTRKSNAGPVRANSVLN